MGQPVFYLLAGPNGAGKSTLYRALVLAGTIPATAEFVNADLHEATQLQHITNPEQRSEQARQWADAHRAALLQAGQSFVSETVFSHASKLALIQEAQNAGFFVTDSGFLLWRHAVSPLACILGYKPNQPLAPVERAQAAIK